MFFNQNILLSKSYIEEKLSNGVTYFVEKYYDNFLSSDFLMLIGKLDDDSYIFLRSPLESIREGIKTSNTFLFITGMIILVLSSGLAFFISKRFTKPIYELNAITKKMSNLDFSTKYTVTSDDEIGMLGNSINSLSENLENKIKELREANMELEKDIEETSKIVEMRSQFISDVSHELKTPLASMREGTELLADQVVGPLTPEQKEVVSILDSSSRNLQKLIEQLLDYNRKQADSAVELENVELAPLVETVVSAHSLPARAKIMHTDVDLKATACLAKPMLLMSVLDNLYSNAVHYGAESGNICLRSSLHGARVYIDVINTGTPIPQEERAMIFEPFFQGSHQRKGAVKGSGLGLSIARDCIRRMQGELYLVDESGQDVCFRIELPSSKNTK